VGNSGKHQDASSVVCVVCRTAMELLSRNFGHRSRRLMDD